jgi:hypothetical protein
MKSDIADVIAELVRQKNPDVDSRLAYQAEELGEVRCTSPLMGRWVDSHDVEYMLSALDLDDEDFAPRFPAAAHVRAEERRRLAAAMESHLGVCKHCSLKRGFEVELDGRIERACLENRDFLLRLVEDEEAAAGGGNGGDGEAERVVSASRKI